jgi:hypothetical protein
MRGKFMAILVGVALSACSIVHAATVTWSNNAGGAWETIANWSPPKVPSQGDDVVTVGAGTGTITLNSNVTIHSLTLSSGKLSLASGVLSITPAPPPARFNLAVTIGGDGSGTVTSLPSGIDCGAICISDFNQGREVTMTAVADPDSVFSGWSGGGCAGNAGCSVTVNADTEVTANFALQVIGVPSAAFTLLQTSPVAHQLIQFADRSTGLPSSWAWDFGDGATSSLQNPSHAYSSSGTFAATLTVSNLAGTSSVSHDIVVTPEFTMTQTVSDGAQRTTLAFSGFAMMTGNLEAQSFFPPGKVADYTGFQYLRDNDPDNMGHNTSFLTRIANNVIYILNDSQFAQLKTLASASSTRSIFTATSVSP